MNNNENFYKKIALRNLIKNSILEGCKVIHFESVAIQLPSNQTAGTPTQKIEYAKYKASQICNTIIDLV